MDNKLSLQFTSLAKKVQQARFGETDCATIGDGKQASKV